MAHDGIVGVSWHGTTVLAVRKGGQVVMAGDGQVTHGQTILKSNANKLRVMQKGRIIAGFAGNTADALTLFARLENKLEEHGRLTRACAELAKEWRMDKYLQRLEAMMLVADKEHTFLLSGSGDMIQPEYDVISIGSGGNYAMAAGRALYGRDDMDAEAIVREAMAIAADLCIYTNHAITVLKAT
ncbi:MAG: ATP-dependent protease subunit HslV [Alphaproteobacteria bacterium GM7ARS4]|nr:ATP-dependent protease subunit HslV [Alphaproteobacteria bacterium GM7ARS4]